GSVLGIAVVAAAVLAAAAAIPVAGAFVAKARADSAADAAALAAADTLSGRIPGYPCEQARHLAELDATSLTSCGISGLIATVAVETRYAGLTITARARAGPPTRP
ncbi:Rv3654c family TadE-like protein, partial [Gryllotalpicola sp.]|uniref:Rv3654c family TadE-like protein n=1 Tax=Gryllotalpicola sp. TaxID=1932787 RepID=UPI00260C7CB2